MSILTELPELPDTAKVMTTHHPDGLTPDMLEVCRITRQVPVHAERTDDTQLTSLTSHAESSGLSLTVTSSRIHSDKDGTIRDHYDPVAEPAKIWPDLMRLAGEVKRIRDVWDGPINWLFDWEHFVVTPESADTVAAIFHYSQYRVLHAFPQANIEWYGFGWHPADVVLGYKKYNWYVDDVWDRQSSSLYFGPQIGQHRDILEQHGPNVTAWLSPGSYYRPFTNAWGYKYETGTEYEIGYSYREGRMIFDPWMRHPDRVARYGPHGTLDRVVLYGVHLPNFVEHFYAMVKGATD